MKNNLRKNTIWNIIGTGLNAFNSLFLMIAVTRINGVFDAGIFTFAFSTATLFNVVGVYAGRIYQVTDREGRSNKDYLINRIISCIVMLLISIIFINIKNYSLSKQFIIFALCLLKMLEAFAEVLYAFSQNKNELYKVGISLTVKSLIGLFVFIVCDFITKNLIISIVAYIIVYLLIMILYDMKQVHISYIIKQKVNMKNVISIFIKGFSTFAVAFLTMYLINASKYSIDNQIGENIQAIFGIIIMPATVMILIAQFVIHPFLIMISDYIEEKKYNDLSKLVLKILLFIIALGALLILACYILGIPVLEFIYGIPLKKYTLCLIIILTGAICYALTSIINTVLIAMRHTATQMYIYIFLAVFAMLSSNYLVKAEGITGAALSYFLSMLLSCIIFIITFIIFIKKDGRKNG